jgi:hypothetical protein
MHGEPWPRYHCYAPHVRRFANLLMIVTLSGCRGDDAEADADETDDDAECQDLVDPQFVSLIDHAAWQATAAQDDPLIDHRPSTVDCGIAGWYVESDQLEIDTNFCNYAALRQDSLRAIEACDPLRIEFYHFDLLAPEPAQAHAALLIDGQVVWEKFIDIPGDGMIYKAAVYEEEFLSPIAAPAGAEVMLHLHNHGQNTWTLLSVEVAET